MQKTEKRTMICGLCFLNQDRTLYVHIRIMYLGISNLVLKYPASFKDNHVITMKPIVWFQFLNLILKHLIIRDSDEIKRVRLQPPTLNNTYKLQELLTCFMCVVNNFVFMHLVSISIKN